MFSQKTTNFVHGGESVGEFRRVNGARHGFVILSVEMFDAAGCQEYEIRIFGQIGFDEIEAGFAVKFLLKGGPLESSFFVADGGLQDDD